MWLLCIMRIAVRIALIFSFLSLLYSEYAAHSANKSQQMRFIAFFRSLLFVINLDNFVLLIFRNMDNASMWHVNFLSNAC